MQPTIQQYNHPAVLCEMFSLSNGRRDEPANKTIFIGVITVAQRALAVAKLQINV